MNKKTKDVLFTHPNVTADTVVYLPNKPITLSSLDKIIKHLSSEWDASISGETQKFYNVPAATVGGNFSGNQELWYYAESVDVTFSKKNMTRTKNVHLRLECPYNGKGGWTKVVFWSPNQHTIKIIEALDHVINSLAESAPVTA
jgi:hypothetical protein